MRVGATDNATDKFGLIQETMYPKIPSYFTV